MRQYVWYSPDRNVIVLQTFMDGCMFAFEWSHEDLYFAGREFGTDNPLIQNFFWVPLGEL